MMREGLAQLIAHQPQLEVCGEAGAAAEALQKITALQPDLVLTDIALPGRSGLELIKDIKAVLPQTLILVLSMHDETVYVERVLRAGARGYIMKQEGGKKIVHAIHQILSGQVSVSEKMSAKILEIFSGRRAQAAASPVERLSDREFEVFQLTGAGLATREIADRLRLSPKTVEVHRAKIKSKLQLSKMADLIRYSARWVESPPTAGGTGPRSS